MAYLFGFYLFGCVALLFAGIVEQRRHHRTLRAIPVRIVVNGTRGKSSITRLCAGALRAGGLVTVAKTTGSAARFITPDGQEDPVYRKFGVANIVEQIGVVRRGAAHRADALVIECMAVLPDLQEVNERKLIRSTICVICNVREDHLAEMGPTLDDVARSLARSMPAGGICVTAEQDRADLLEAQAQRRGTTLIRVDPAAVTDAEIRRFPYITFKDNVAVALAVAELAGVDRDTALDGMVAAAPDPGAITVQTRRAGTRTITLANVLAANDPASTLMNVDLLVDRRLIVGALNIVINCRPDRIERNGQMGELTGRLHPERIVLIGEHTRSARLRIPDDLAGRVIELGSPLSLDALLDALVTDPSENASLVAIGNIHGQGEVLLEQWDTLPPAPPPDPGPAPSTGRALPRQRHDHSEPPTDPVPILPPASPGRPAEDPPTEPVVLSR